MRKILSLVLGLLWVLPVWGALPTGYTQLEYIESTGRQYIDTGYIPNSNTRWELDNEYTETPPTKNFFNGLYQDEMRFDIALGVNGMYLNYGVSNIPNSNTSSFINTRYMYVVDAKNNKWAYNDTTGSFPSYSNMVTITKPLYLFARNDASGVERFAKQRTYSSKIYDDGILVRNFVPAKNASGVVGLYDTVNNRFYTNAGTGEFVAGDPVPDNSCRNLFDKDAEYINAYVNANSGVLTRGDSQYSFVIPVQPNTKYTLSGMSSGSSWGSFADNSIGATATSKLAGNGTLTTGANDKYLIGLAYASGTQYDYRQTLQIEEGDTATEYVPYCEKIKIATTKYNETKFSPLNTALANAISVVDSVVSNTINQAASIATLQAQKQTRPNDIADDSEKCPAGKKCLLVEDATGVPHWYEIVTSILPDGYTELQYIESTGTQYIDTGFVSSREAKFGIKFRDTLFQEDKGFFGSSSWVNSLSFYSTTIRYCLNDTAFSLNITNATHSGELICSSAGVVGTLDGREVSFPQVTDSNRGSGNIYLFSGGRNRSGLKTKIDWFKIWDSSGTLVRNFVPAKNPDGKIGMYDLVGGRFYENQGTGEFIAGDPVAE